MTSSNAYDRTNHIENTILHLGTGAFHRAHQAWYLHNLRSMGDKRWNINVGNIRSDGNAVLEALIAQKGRYTLETVTSDGQRTYETITSIERALPWQEDMQNVSIAGADPRTRIISFTVTEARYYLDAHRRLNLGHMNIRTDLAGARTTIYGAITAILQARRIACAGPITLLSCDNLRGNGACFRAGMLAFLAAFGDASLQYWFEHSTRCPNTMVDRIVPRPSAELIERVRAAQYDDLIPVMGEHFDQWVIEDDFIAGRPDWERVGVQLVASVLPYEEAKIRILNATHSCIAWAGTLAGLTFIHEGAQHPVIKSSAFDFITQDVIPSLSPSPIDLLKYRDSVLNRLSNPFILDTNERVATDSFSKVPGFIVPTLSDRITANQSFTCTARVLALFFLFLRACHENRLPYAYADSVMAPGALHAIFSSDDPVCAFAGDALLFGTLAKHSALLSALQEQLALVRDAVGQL